MVSLRQADGVAELSLAADHDQLATIREFVAEAGRQLGLAGKTIRDLQLAVDEACTNVIEHAYGGRGGEIQVRIEPTDQGLRVTIRDWGQAFDPEAVPVPDVTAPLEQRPLGGLGLFLMRQLMDRVEFEFDAETGNRLVMEKQIRRSQR